MEIKPEKLKGLIAFFLDSLKQMEIELVAHKMLFVSLKEKYPVSDLDDSLALAKIVAENLMNQKYADREKFSARFDEAVQNQETFSKFLEKWSPKDPVN